MEINYSQIPFQIYNLLFKIESNFFTFTEIIIREIHTFSSFTHFHNMLFIINMFSFILT